VPAKTSAAAAKTARTATTAKTAKHKKAATAAKPTAAANATHTGASSPSSAIVSHRSAPVYYPPPAPRPPSTGLAGATLKNTPATQLHRAHRRRHKKS
jgi:hypothetical protein